jgi:hypothetical protein
MNQPLYSEYAGVKPIQQTGEDGIPVIRYSARFYCNKIQKKINCGLFDTEKKAAQVRDFWCVFVYGDANPQRLNFPNDLERYKRDVHAKRVRDAEKVERIKEEIRRLNAPELVTA